MGVWQSRPSRGLEGSVQPTESTFLSLGTPRIGASRQGGLLGSSANSSFALSPIRWTPYCRRSALHQESRGEENPGRPPLDPPLPADSVPHRHANGEPGRGIQDTRRPSSAGARPADPSCRRTHSQSASKGSTSTSTAMRSSTGTCRRTRSISSNARDASTVSRATRSGAIPRPSTTTPSAHTRAMLGKLLSTSPSPTGIRPRTTWCLIGRSRGQPS